MPQGNRQTVEHEFVPMTMGFASEIATWHYEGIYSFYDLDEDPEDREEFLDPSHWSDACFAVLDARRELIGFFHFEASDDAVVLGLGLRPDLTGHGLGSAFLEAGLAFARNRYEAQAFRLSVATFNERAVRAYEKAGFVRGKVFQQETNGGVYEFVEMTRSE